MEILELVVPTMAHKEQVMAYKAEMLENHSRFDGCNGLRTVETYEEWLDFRGRDEKKSWVPASGNPERFAAIGLHYDEENS